MNLDSLPDLRADALARIAGAQGLDALKAVDVAVLGKKAPITALNQRLGLLEPDARKAAGALLNETRGALTQALADRREVLAAEEHHQRLEAERLDLGETIGSSLPGHAHLVRRHG